MLAVLVKGFGFWAEVFGLWGVLFQGFGFWTEVFGLWDVAFRWISSLYSLKGSGWKTESMF